MCIRDRGDLLLQRVAGRLQGCVRASDTVARLGGDEFVMLLESGRNKEHAQTVVNKLLAAFAHPFDLEGNVLHMHPSIGTALYPEDGDDAAALLDHADPVSYTHLRAHETVLDLVCRLLLEKKNTKIIMKGK